MGYLVLLSTFDQFIVQSRGLTKIFNKFQKGKGEFFY